MQVFGNCLFLQDFQKGSEATEGIVQQVVCRYGRRAASIVPNVRD